MDLISLCLLLLLSPLLADASITNIFLYTQLPKCDNRAEYRMIADSCEPTCTQPEPACLSSIPSHRLPDLPKCRCKAGFYRNSDGACVTLTDCLVDVLSLEKRSIVESTEAEESETRVKRDSTDGVDYSSIRAEGGHTPLDIIVGFGSLILQWPALVRAAFVARN